MPGHGRLRMTSTFHKHDRHTSRLLASNRLIILLLPPGSHHLHICKINSSTSARCDCMFTTYIMAAQILPPLPILFLQSAFCFQQIQNSAKGNSTRETCPVCRVADSEPGNGSINCPSRLAITFQCRLSIVVALIVMD